MFFAISNVKKTAVKVPLQQWDLPLWVNKKYVANPLPKVLFTEDVKSEWDKE